jgi:hypothetical protein
MSPKLDTEAIIVDLLKRAAEAHGVYEKAELGGKYDTNWPAWYAAHMTRALAEAGLKIAPADE